MRPALAVCLLLVAGPLAVAGNDVGFDTANKIATYHRGLLDAKQGLGSIKPELSARGCTDVVARARQAGLNKLVHAEFDKLGGQVTKDSDTKYEITLDRAAKLCAEYAPYYAVGQHERAFSHALQLMEVLTPDNAPAAELVKTAVAEAATCTRLVADVIAAGVPATFAFALRGAPFTVADLRPRICDALAKAAGQYTKDAAAAKKTNEERFTRVGIKGDKLALMIKYDRGVFLAGGGSSSDLKTYAQASVLFVWTTSAADAEGHVVHTVRRHQFVGDKLTKTTEQTYRKRKADKLGDVFR